MGFGSCSSDYDITSDTLCSTASSPVTFTISRYAIDNNQFPTESCTDAATLSFTSLSSTDASQLFTFSCPGTYDAPQNVGDSLTITCSTLSSEIPNGEYTPSFTFTETTYEDGSGGVRDETSLNHAGTGIPAETCSGKPAISPMRMAVKRTKLRERRRRRALRERLEKLKMNELD